MPSTHRTSQAVVKCVHDNSIIILLEIYYFISLIFIFTCVVISRKKYE